MVERRLPIPIEEAVKRVLQEMDVPVRTESVPLLDAMQRFLAADLVADHDVPPFDRSPYDGYALRSFDTAQASRSNPVRLKTVGEIGAGTVFAGDVKAGETVRIMTGAKIPNGCDAVAMLEVVKEESDGYITVVRPFAANTNISFQGEDTRKGTPLVKKAAMSILASPLCWRRSDTITCRWAFSQPLAFCRRGANCWKSANR